MKYRMIGITAVAQAGKDTAADAIIRIMPGYFKTSFGDPLKNMLKTGLGLTNEQLWGDEKEIIDPRYNKSPRHMMQTLGTEWGRGMIDSNIWINALDARIKANGGSAVVPDVRFDSEADFIRKNGVLIHIEGRDVLKLDHKSEAGVCQKKGDIIMTNAGSLEEYYNTIEKVIADLL